MLHSQGDFVKFPRAVHYNSIQTQHQRSVNVSDLFLVSVLKEVYGTTGATDLSPEYEH